MSDNSEKEPANSPPVQQAALSGDPSSPHLDRKVGLEAIRLCVFKPGDIATLKTVDVNSLDESKPLTMVVGEIYYAADLCGNSCIQIHCWYCDHHGKVRRVEVPPAVLKHAYPKTQPSES